MIINKPTFVTHITIPDKFASGSCVTVFRCSFLTERTYDFFSVILDPCNSAISTVLFMHRYMNGGGHKWCIGNDWVWDLHGLCSFAFPILPCTKWGNRNSSRLPGSWPTFETSSSVMFLRSCYTNLLVLATDDIETCPHKLRLLWPPGVKESNTYQAFSLAKCVGKAIQTVIEFPVLRRETGTVFPCL